MTCPTVRPVFVGLRTGLHVLFVALIALVVGNAVLEQSPQMWAIVVSATVLTVTYACGGCLAGSVRPGTRMPGLVWLGAIVAQWVVLLLLSPEAAYLVFPLFFLFQYLLGGRWGTVAVVVSTGVAIVSLGVAGGFSVNGIIGPLVGAVVAVMIGVGYRALTREAEARNVLMAELVATRDQLAATEHESGVLAERGRLAREIHDTVAQGLSSIQLLLHAAERVDAGRPGLEHIRLARETAASGLADTRRFIRELAPPDLGEVGLGGTLRRLAETQWAPQGLVVKVRVSDIVSVPMHVQSALLRIAQGAIANVIQHAEASSATVSLEVDGAGLRFMISDDGRGFDPASPPADGGMRSSDSFGLQATRERVDQLGGELRVVSAPGGGTSVIVDLVVPGES